MNTLHSRPPATDPDKNIPKELGHLPKDVGWILLLSGLLSEVGAPGMPPFWIAGVMILWPTTGYRIAKPLRKHFPRAFAHSMKMISRYADDLERRYPLTRSSER